MCFLMIYNFLMDFGLFRNFQNCILKFLKKKEFWLNLANFKFLKTVFKILNPKTHQFYYLSPKPQFLNPKP